MSDDKQKLIQILNDLEQDYADGLISEEKYIYLSNQYKHKIETIDVSNRIRAMQGREEPIESESYTDRTRARRNREEDERLVRKYIQNPEPYTHSKAKKEEEKTSSPWTTVLAIIFLLIAFGVGITFGISTFGLDGDITDVIIPNAAINDTAFPQVVANKTADNNFSKNSTKTDYSVLDDDSDSSDSSDSSSSASQDSSKRSSDSSSSSSQGGSSSSQGGSSSSGGSSSQGGSSSSSGGSSDSGGGGSGSSGGSSDSGGGSDSE